MPTSPLLFIVTLSLLVIIGLLLFVILKLRSALATPSEDRIKELLAQTFVESSDLVTNQTKQALSGDREVIKTDLANKHTEMLRMIKGLEQTVEQRQTELKTLEKERATQFGSLTKQLQEQQRVTDTLSATTAQLAQALNSNQQRGGWGERLIEDLLRSNGLQEGVHFVRQKPLGATQVRPDITLLLPDKHTVPIDVKFPFSALQQWASTDDKVTKENLLKQFRTDVKTHITKVATYIMPAEGTLDYAVLFVPNEAVFSFLNQKLPDLVDYALSERVLITSPFTFLIVARTIMESYRNFLLGDKLREVLDQIDGFVGEWEKYRASLDKFGASVESMSKQYHDLTGTRTRQLSKRVERVQTLGQKALPSK